MEKKRTKKLGLAETITLPDTCIMPIWTNSEIVAATDFSVWEFILVDGFSTKIREKKETFLFPQLMGKVFKNYSLISNKPDEARKQLLNLIREIRSYRNRVFHHEPLWIKSPTVTDDKTAIDTIRKKINRAEKIIKCINIKKYEVLDKVGIFYHARRVCSIDELSIYTYKEYGSAITTEQKEAIRKILYSVDQKNKSKAFEYEESVYVLHKIR